MSSVDAYFERINNEHLRQLAYALHDYIMALDPNITCTIKWRIPTYDYKKYLFYMNVSLKRNRIELGFAQGKFLLDPLNQFDNHEKLVAHVYFTDIKRLADNDLYAIFEEAIDYQKQHC